MALNRVTPVGETLPMATPERDTALAILNGVWGDHLEASRNPLAIQMSLRLDGVPLIEYAPLASRAGSIPRPMLGALPAGLPPPGKRLLLLVHGLCVNDLGWFTARTRG